MSGSILYRYAPRLQLAEGQLMEMEATEHPQKTPSYTKSVSWHHYPMGI